MNQFKTLVALFLSVITLSSTRASGEEVQMNGESIRLNSQNVVLVRTASTPKRVLVTFPVSMVLTRCAETGTRMVYGQHPTCGTETTYEYECYINTVCHDVPDYCGGTPNCGGVHRECQDYTRCGYYPRTRYRSCYYSETYCVREELYNQPTEQQLSLRFRRTVKLQGDQTEKYQLIASQALVNESTYQVSVTAQNTQAPYKVRGMSKSYYNGERSYVLVRRTIFTWLKSLFNKKEATEEPEFFAEFFSEE